MRPASAKLTYDDLAAMPDDGMRHEIIGGEHHVTPSPVTKHQWVAGNLYVLLSNHVRRHHAGAVFMAPFDVVLSIFDIVEPDLLFVSSDRRTIVDAQNVKGAPDLVIEVLSPGTRKVDETMKRALYERAGVAEYWLVDPDAENIRIFRRDASGEFAAAVELLRQRNDDLITPLLPGVSLPLVDVFAPPF